MFLVILAIMILFFVGIPVVSLVGFDIITAVCITPLMLLMWAATQL